jgi:Family of unknown function (DUF5677)
MNIDERRSSFEAEGFLGTHMSEDIAGIRLQIRDWFELARDVSRELQAAAVRGVERNRGSNWDPATVATRLLLRSCGTFQGIILMVERGMVTEGQTLARALLENAFCMAALHDKPDDFLSLLKADAEAARREQGQFVIAQGLVGSEDAETRKRLAEVIDAIGTDPSFLSQKEVAGMGPLTRQYLAYQKLTNDAAHPSAASLHRFMSTNADRSGWNYRWGPGKNSELAFTLMQAIHAAVPIGIGYTQITGDAEHNERFRPIADRLEALPEPDGSLAESSVGF